MPRGIPEEPIVLNPNFRPRNWDLRLMIDERARQRQGALAELERALRGVRRMKFEPVRPGRP